MALWKEYPRKEQLSVETDHSEETPSRPELRYRVEDGILHWCRADLRGENPGSRPFTACRPLRGNRSGGW